MGRNIKLSMSKKGRGRFAATAVISGGALLMLLGLALAPVAAIAQEESDPQQPSWQQRPVQQTAYYGASTAYAGSPRATRSSQTMAPQTAGGQRYRHARQASTRPVSQAVLAEPVSADGAVQASPEEIYPQASPEAGDYGSYDETGDYGTGESPLVEEEAYCDSCGGNCDGTCGGYGEACGYGGCWGGECYGGPCWPWLGMEEGRLWARMDYLMWWTEGVHVPALVTTSTSASVSQANAGVLGLDTTRILLGEEDINKGARGGGRISFGLRPTECTPWGVEASYFQLETEKTSFSEESDGWPILARPYYDLANARAASSLIGYPDTYAGQIGVEAATRFKGLEVLFRRQAYNWCTGQLDFLAGWRYNRMDDHLVINSLLTEGPLLVEGDSFNVLDRFDTKNVFNGGEFGFVAQTQYCRWSFEALMKVAFGSTKSTVSLAGLTTASDDEGNVEESNCGMLVLPSNEGIRERTRFGMIPEFGATVGYDLTCRLRATFGYTVIYWGNVARAGDQVNLDLNSTQFTSPGASSGLARPSQPFVSNDFWAQGMNFGLEYHF